MGSDVEGAWGGLVDLHRHRSMRVPSQWQTLYSCVRHLELMRTMPELAKTVGAMDASSVSIAVHRVHVPPPIRHALLACVLLACVLNVAPYSTALITLYDVHL